MQQQPRRLSSYLCETHVDSARRPEGQCLDKCKPQWPPPSPGDPPLPSSAIPMKTKATGREWPATHVDTSGEPNGSAPLLLQSVGLYLDVSMNNADRRVQSELFKENIMTLTMEKLAAYAAWGLLAPAAVVSLPQPAVANHCDVGTCGWFSSTCSSYTPCCACDSSSNCSFRYEGCC